MSETDESFDLSLQNVEDMDRVQETGAQLPSRRRTSLEPSWQEKVRMKDEGRKGRRKEARERRREEEGRWKMDEPRLDRYNGFQTQMASGIIHSPGLREVAEGDR